MTPCLLSLDACVSLQLLPMISRIESAELRRQGVTLSLAYYGSLDPDHILYGILSGSLYAHQKRLRYRRPFVLTTRNLFNNLARLGIRAFKWKNYRWNTEYCENTSRLRVFIFRTSARVVGMSFPRTAWVS